MKNDNNKISRETYERMAEFIRIGNRGVREAQAGKSPARLAEYLLAQRQNHLRNAGRRDYC